MNFKKLANLLLLAGIVLLAVALIWWANFYGPIMNELHSKLSKALDCLYSSGGACGLAAGISQIFGKTPYNPVVFWIGAGAAAAGVLMRMTLKPQS